MSQPENEEQRERTILQHEAEHAKPHKKSAVLGYLAILFAAAFLLLLLSYLQQQRNSEEVISGLKSSASAVQSIENLIAEKESLAQQVEDLEGEKSKLADELAQKTQQAEQAIRDREIRDQNSLSAMDWFAEIKELYGKQYYKTARKMITVFEATGLRGSLPTIPLFAYEGADVASPAQRYQEIYDELFPDGESAN